MRIWNQCIDCGRFVGYDDILSESVSFVDIYDERGEYFYTETQPTCKRCFEK